MNIWYKINAQVASRDTGKLNYLYGRFFYCPKTDKRQQLINVTAMANPKADTIDISRAYFEWRTLHDKYSFSYEAKIATKPYLFPIKDEAFPVEKDDKLRFYYRFDDFIDKSEVLSLFSMVLTEGEQSLLGAVTSIGEWVYENIKYKGELVLENIEYGEGNYSGFVVAPASSVVSQMSGLSIEFSTLFISLLRCVDIPARFIAGIAEVDGRMREHAWVEVYFKESGWVPFDPVLGQFGFLDATHVTLNTSKTISSILMHEWRYLEYFGEINMPVVKEPEIESKIVESASTPMEPVAISINSLVNEVGHESYVPIVVTVRNKMPFSVADRIVLPVPPNVILEGHYNTKLVTLRPYEEKQISYLIRLEEEYNKNIDYHAFLKVHDQFGTTDGVLISFENKDLVYTEEQCNEALDTLSIFGGFNATNISFSAKSLKKYYFTDEQPRFTTQVHEPKSVEPRDVNVISYIQNSFTYAQSVSVPDTVKADVKERYIFPCLKDSGQMVCRPVIFNRINEPKLFFQITDIGAASQKRKSQYKFEVEAIGELKDIRIIFRREELIRIEELDGELSEVITLPSRLKLRNRLRFEVVYTDKKGKTYHRKYFKRIVK